LSARPAANGVTAGSTFFATDQVVAYISDGTNWIRTSLPAGATIDWFKPDAAVPAGWVLYDGTNLPASTGIYADLYAHLGNTLTKPDTQGRGTVGKGTHSDVSAVGVNDGLAVATRTPVHNSTNVLTLPTHGHTTSDPGHSHGLSDPGHAHSISDPGHGHYIDAFNHSYASGGIGTWDFASTAQAGSNVGYAKASGTGIGIYAAGTGMSMAAAATGFSVGNNSSSPAIAGSIGPGGTRPTDRGAYIVCAKIGKL